MADIILEKLKENADKNDIYICCDTGESRSIAITAAMMRFYNQSDKMIWSVLEIDIQGQKYSFCIDNVHVF